MLIVGAGNVKSSVPPLRNAISLLLCIRFGSFVLFFLKYMLASLALLIKLLLQAGRAGRSVGQRILPEGEQQPVCRERLRQHQGDGWIHHLILHAPRQVTLSYSPVESDLP